jgi:hypothetical protein
LSNRQVSFTSHGRGGRGGRGSRGGGRGGRYGHGHGHGRGRGRGSGNRGGRGSGHSASFVDPKDVIDKDFDNTEWNALTPQYRAAVTRHRELKGGLFKRGASAIASSKADDDDEDLPMKKGAKIGAIDNEHVMELLTAWLGLTDWWTFLRRFAPTKDGKKAQMEGPAVIDARKKKAHLDLTTSYYTGKSKNYT